MARALNFFDIRVVKTEIALLSDISYSEEGDGSISFDIVMKSGYSIEVAVPSTEHENYPALLAAHAEIVAYLDSDD